MDVAWKSALSRQFGAAIDMLENAVEACPDDLWNDSSETPEFWYVAFHALFYLDFYSAGSPSGFAPPPPFTLSELDPAGPPPERRYTKAEIRAYLRHARDRWRRRTDSLSEENAGEASPFLDGDLTAVELALYNMRHVQHHTGQLNLMLRRKTDSAPRWVRRAAAPPP